MVLRSKTPGRSGAKTERLLLLAGALFLLLGFAFETSSQTSWQPHARQASEFRLVTWNVGSSTKDAGVRLRDEHIDHVAEVLRGIDADLVVLQELRDRGQLQQLLLQLPAGARAHHTRGRDGRPVSILAWRGSLTRHRLPGGLAVRYQSAVFGSIIVVGVHADPFSAKARNALLGRVVQVLEADFEGQPRLLAGDLNLDLDIGKRRDLFSDNEYRDVETYNYISERFEDVGHAGGATAEPDRRLDYIFVDPWFFEVQRAGPWKQQRAGDMDHDPLIADLRLRRDAS